LELIKAVVPKVSRVALLRNPDNPADAAMLRELEAAARALGVGLQTLEARNHQEIERAFAAMIRERAGALLILPDAIFQTQRGQIAELAAKGRLPAVGRMREDAEAGCLMAYGANYRDLVRGAASPPTSLSSSPRSSSWS
jgi:putative ABC transport system substrate-binding protein